MEPVDYRDVWLSEGFATFSGLWYMQSILHANDKYFKQLRESRKRIRAARQDAPPIVLASRTEHYELMTDLKVLALRTDLTRVVTFMMGMEQSSRPYPQIGIPEGHHPLSHHGQVPQQIEKMSKINRYHMELFTKYLAKLRATPDGDGNLLDHSMVLYGSSLSDGNEHNFDPLPVVLVGGGSGRLKGNRHLRHAPHTPMSNLLLAILHKMGAPVEKIGDSTEPLAI